MAGSTSNLDLISSSQAQKEVTANALFDAASPALIFGRRASACAALTWGYYGGPFAAPAGSAQIANATVALTASTTNYVEVDVDGVVSVNTTGFSVDAIALYEIVTGTATVTSYTDWRAMPNVLDQAGVSSVAQSVPDEFSVAGSPITGSGTLTVTKVVQNANKVWAGPTSGGAAQPAFRALVQADLPLQAFDVHAFYPGVPPDGALVLRVPVARAVDFAANFAGSYFSASADASAQAVFTVRKNGTSIGTVTIAAGSTTPTFATSGGAAQSLAAGDVLSLSAPSTADATLSDVGFVLSGTR